MSNLMQSNDHFDDGMQRKRSPPFLHHLGPSQEGIDKQRERLGADLARVRGDRLRQELLCRFQKALLEVNSNGHILADLPVGKLLPINRPGVGDYQYLSWLHLDGPQTISDTTLPQQRYREKATLQLIVANALRFNGTQTIAWKRMAAAHQFQQAFYENPDVSTGTARALSH